MPVTSTPRVRLLAALPRRITRPLSWLAVAAWVVCMAVLVQRTYLQASPASLAADLARYGTEAEWRGVYYRGEKVGFTVGQIVPTEGGFELQEDGRLQMSLLGATTPAAIRTTARVDQAFLLRSFDFSLDPGTGPLTLSGTVDGLTLNVEIRSAGSVRTETRTLAEPPALMLNMARRLASAGLAAGATHRLMVFDPATLANQPVTVRVHEREIVVTSGRPIPAFKVDLGYAGLTTTAWITDTGAIVREESPLGLMSVRESPEQAQQMAVSARVRSDMLQAAAIVPTLRVPVTEPTDVVRLKVEFTGVDLAGFDFAGSTQRLTGRVLDVTDPRALVAGPADPDRLRYLAPETLIESDDPAIVEQARRIVAGATDPRTRAERLVREVNAMLDKKPTVSLPSAREVLRTKVGDCNEHTALYVALARAAGLPARINVGLAMVRGAFYYHAWPEVWIDDGPSRGYWLPVDPTFNQFPADATHLRLLQGGLDRQTAILPLIGRLELTVLEAEMAPNTSPVIVGREFAEAADARPLSIAL
ncbi:MAG: transglutaminase domain-containing protein, partial [Vicinamibacterales bacterium]